jgi:hypothetical protein
MNRKRLLFVSLLLLIVGVTSYVFHRQARRGPIYEGRPVGDWVALAMLHDTISPDDAGHVVIKIGAPAVPFIVEQGLHDKNHRLLNKWIEWLRWHLPEKIQWLQPYPCNGRHEVAAWMLSEIGKPAHAAVPDVINCLERCPDNHFMQTIELLDALRDISDGTDEAIPFLTKVARRDWGSISSRAAADAYYLNGQTNLIVETFCRVVKKDPEALLDAQELFWFAQDHALNQYLVPLLVEAYSDPRLTVQNRESILFELQSRSNDATAALAQLAAMNQTANPPAK